MKEKDEEVLVALQTVISYCNNTGCSACAIKDACESYTTLPFNEWGKEPIK